ncbi:MAG: Gfo/Idh/MocA family protein, partial [Armatimonadota bacterium]
YTLRDTELERFEPVAAVDINPDALKNAQEKLGLPAEKCYTDVARALDENEADFCTVVVPPAHHEEIVDAALAHGLNILSEKPIADTLEASCRIADKVKAAGVKMGVTMSHRFRQDITTLRSLIQSGDHGPLDYLVCRFTCDNRRFASWGKFRHEIPDTLMVEGSVHHLDLLADMCGGTCDTIYAQTWKPPWGEFAGDCQGLVIMHLDNDTRATYEGAKTNAAQLNGWGQEYIRAECEKSTLILDSQKITRHDWDPQRGANLADQGEPVELLDQPKWANTWLIEKFCKWLDGDEPMETNVEANLQSVALIFAAIESSHTGEPIKVQEFLQKTRESVQ